MSRKAVLISVFSFILLLSSTRLILAQDEGNAEVPSNGNNENADQPLPTSQATTSKPSTTQVTSVRPSTSQAPTTQPSTSKAPTSQPSTSKAPTSQPSTSQAPTSQPSTSQAPTSQPSTSQAPTSQPSTSQAPTSQPSTSQVPTSKPSTSQAPTSKPSTSQAPTSQPSTSQAPTSKPSTSQAPTSKPSTSQAPTSKPSTSQAPTSQPSTSQAPTSKPSTSQAPTSQPSTSQAPTSKPSTPQAPTSKPSTSQAPTGKPSTSKAPSTSPRPSPTTAASTTTSPPPIPFPNNIGNWTGDSSKNESCIHMIAALEIFVAVRFNEGEKNKTITIPKEATFFGNCSNSTAESMSLQWNVLSANNYTVTLTNILHLKFEMVPKKDTYQLAKVNFTFSPLQFEGSNETKTIISYVAEDMKSFVTPKDKSYSCSHNQSISFHDGNGDFQFQLNMANVQLEAFKPSDSSSPFKPSLSCPADSPGHHRKSKALLIGLTVTFSILLVAAGVGYYFWRRRARGTGYQRLDDS